MLEAGPDPEVTRKCWEASINKVTTPFLQVRPLHTGCGCWKQREDGGGGCTLNNFSSVIVKNAVNLIGIRMVVGEKRIPRREQHPDMLWEVGDACSGPGTIHSTIDRARSSMGVNRVRRKNLMPLLTEHLLGCPQPLWKLRWGGREWDDILTSWYSPNWTRCRDMTMATHTKGSKNTEPPECSSWEVAATLSPKGKLWVEGEIILIQESDLRTQRQHEGTH